MSSLLSDVVPLSRLQGGDGGDASQKILRELRSGKLEMPVQDLTSDALTYLRAQVEEEIIQREVNKAVQKEVQKVLAERATDDDNQCQICYERPQGHCLIPCGHRMCKECTVSYGGAKSNCPFCQRVSAYFLLSVLFYLLSLFSDLCCLS